MRSKPFKIDRRPTWFSIVPISHATSVHFSFLPLCPLLCTVMWFQDLSSHENLCTSASFSRQFSPPCASVSEASCGAPLYIKSVLVIWCRRNISPVYVYEPQKHSSQYWAYHACEIEWGIAADPRPFEMSSNALWSSSIGWNILYICQKRVLDTI